MGGLGASKSDIVCLVRARSLHALAVPAPYEAKWQRYTICACVLSSPSSVVEICSPMLVFTLFKRLGPLSTSMS